jgi:hypothetical protein
MGKCEKIFRGRPVEDFDCGAGYLTQEFSFCGKCGAALKDQP